MAALASRLKASRTQQAEGVDAARTQPAGRGTDQKRARACTKESPYVFEPEMPRWIAQELREKRQAIASASRGAAAVQVLAQVTQDRPCRSCAAETAGLPLAGIDGEAGLSQPAAAPAPLSPSRVRSPLSPSLSRAPPGSADSSAWNSFIPMHANGSGMACSLLSPAAAFAVQCAGPCSRVFGSCCFPLAVRPDDFSSGTWTCSTCERQIKGAKQEQKRAVAEAQLSVLRETDNQVLREEVDEAALQREAGKHYRHMRLLLHDLIRHNGLPSNSVDTHFSLRLWESAMVQDSLQGNFSLRSTTFAFQNDEVNINGRLKNQQLAVLLGPNYDCWKMCPVECPHCRGTQHYVRMQNPYFSFLVKQQKFKISFSLQWTAVRPTKKQMAIAAMPIVHCASSQ